MTTKRLRVPLGELIQLLYDAYRRQYEDPELAAVAAAATLNQMLLDRRRRDAPAAVWS